jgi:MFS family permease
MLMPSLDTSIANAGLPTLAGAFSASFQQVQWIVLTYLIAITTMIAVAGRLGDIIGRRRLMLAGIALFTVASLLCGVAPTLGLLLVARSAQGLGAAVLMALAVAFVGDTVPKDRAGRVMGLLGTMSAIGTTLGPSLGGLLMAGAGWGAIFLVNAPVGALAFLLAYRHLPADQPAAKTPLLQLTLFRDGALRAGLVMSVLVSAVMMATLVVGPFYLVHGLGLAVVSVGFTLSAGPLVSALTGVPAGRFVDRFGAPRMTQIGLSAVAVGAFAVSMSPARFGVPGYIAPLLIMTSGYAVFQAANNTAIMAGIDSGQRGAVAGLLGLSRHLGLITGASAMGAVFAFGVAAPDITTAPPSAIAAGMRLTFVVAALVILVALTLAVKTRPQRSRTMSRVATLALTTVFTFGMFAATTRPAAAQSTSAATTKPRLQFLLPSGTVVPTGTRGKAIKRGNLVAVQVSYALRPKLAITTTVGWARSRDLVTAGAPKLDIFTYDLGAELRAPQSGAGKRVTFTPFAGAGAGGRSYNHRSFDADATHHVGAYVGVGGEVGVRRVGVRLEVRDYVTGFKPLVGGGSMRARNDVVVLAGLRLSRR